MGNFYSLLEWLLHYNPISELGVSAVHLSPDSTINIKFNTNLQIFMKLSMKISLSQ